MNFSLFVHTQAHTTHTHLIDSASPENPNIVCNIFALFLGYSFHLEIAWVALGRQNRSEYLTLFLQFWRFYFSSEG